MVFDEDIRTYEETVLYRFEKVDNRFKVIIAIFISTVNRSLKVY